MAPAGSSWTWSSVRLHTSLCPTCLTHKQLSFVFWSAANTGFLSALLTSSSVHKRTLIRLWLGLYETCALSKHFFPSLKYPLLARAVCVMLGPVVLAVVFGQEGVIQIDHLSV